MPMKKWIPVSIAIALLVIGGFVFLRPVSLLQQGAQIKSISISDHYAEVKISDVKKTELIELLSKVTFRWELTASAQPTGDYSIIIRTEKGDKANSYEMNVFRYKAYIYIKSDRIRGFVEDPQLCLMIYDLLSENGVPS